MGFEICWALCFKAFLDAIENGKLLLSTSFFFLATINENNSQILQSYRHTKIRPLIPFFALSSTAAHSDNKQCQSSRVAMVDLVS